MNSPGPDPSHRFAFELPASGAFVRAQAADFSSGQSRFLRELSAVARSRIGHGTEAAAEILHSLDPAEKVALFIEVCRTIKQILNEEPCPLSKLLGRLRCTQELTQPARLALLGRVYARELSRDGFVAEAPVVLSLSLQLAEKYAPPAQILGTAFELGRALYKSGNQEEALSILGWALAEAEQLAANRRVNTLKYFGTYLKLCARLGEMQLGHEQLKKLRQLWDRLEDGNSDRSIAVSEALVACGQAAAALGAHADAYFYLVQARRIARHLSQSLVQAGAESELGQLLQKQFKPQLAEVWYRRSLATLMGASPAIGGAQAQKLKVIESLIDVLSQQGKNSAAFELRRHLDAQEQNEE